MRSTSFRTIVWVVACTIIALLAVTTGSAVAHEVQHTAHHNAGMHGSGICAWMCATAGVHVVTPIHSMHLFTVAGEVSFRSDSVLLPQFLAPSRSRAPPVYS
ncbi:MAG: hypothetical protein R3B37_10730 [Nitrospira sp.]|nr:hypothetical protein [Nitrospira sp.]